MPSDRKCLRHPGQISIGTCSHCGDPFCAQCAEETEGQWLCLRCFRELSGPVLSRGGTWAIVWTLLAMGLLVVSLLSGLIWPVAGVVVLLVVALVQMGQASGGSHKAIKALVASHASVAGAILLNVPAACFGAATAGQDQGIQAVFIGLWVAIVCLGMSLLWWLKAAQEGARPVWVLVVSLIMPLLGIAPIVGFSLRSLK